MADSPLPKIAIAGSGFANTSATDMTRNPSDTSNKKIYTYSYTVPSGDGTATVTLSTGTDLAGNVLTTPTTNHTFTVDNTAPTGDLTFGSTGPYKQDDLVGIFATFSEDMADTPTPKITIEPQSGSAGLTTQSFTMS